MIINGYTETRIIDLVKRGILELQKKCGLERDYGYFTVLDATDGSILLVCKIGKCPAEKAEKYFVFSQEKARRLFANPTHVSSFQSKDPASDKYAGAIRARSFIFSFSALPELDDEALMTFVAFQLCQIDRLMVSEIVCLSKNPHTFKIINNGQWSATK